jgi:hypothetical protein
MQESRCLEFPLDVLDPRMKLPARFFCKFTLIFLNFDMTMLQITNKWLLQPDFTVGIIHIRAHIGSHWWCGYLKFFVLTICCGWSMYFMSV